jgi:integrase
MATLKFLIQGKGESVNIYVRLSINRENVFKRKTYYIVNSSDWNNVKGIPYQRDDSLKKLKNNIDSLKNKIEINFNDAISKGGMIDGNWLQNQIDDILEKKEKTDLDRFTNYFQYYIDTLPNKVNSKGKKGVSIATLKKYKTIRNKIIDFEKHTKKHYYLKDINLNFRNELIKYFTEVDKLNANSTGRYITFIKTVCNDARKNGIATNPQLDLIKGYTEKVEKIFLNFDEIELIENADLNREALINARDWLIIGCYIGQRVSDLLTLTKENINTRNGLELIELTQKKTGKKVAIPLHPKVKQIIDKRKGEFPTTLSAQRFNDHIKDIAREAKICQKIEGSCMDEESRRKKHGTYEKWQLVTSHICRRSFASNFYGEIPTALLINITAHSTESQFLEYIGKTPTDYAVQLADYWSKQAVKATLEKEEKKKKEEKKDNKKAVLTVVRKVN